MQDLFHSMFDNIYLFSFCITVKLKVYHLSLQDEIHFRLYRTGATGPFE